MYTEMLLMDWSMMISDIVLRSFEEPLKLRPAYTNPQLFQPNCFANFCLTIATVSDHSDSIEPSILVHDNLQLYTVIFFGTSFLSDIDSREKELTQPVALNIFEN